MTERKAFKRRVRSQMERTGQSYARAAAQLEAGNPARVGDRHPASGVVVALLHTAGVDIDPADAFAIGGGIGFMYGLFRYRDAPEPLLTLVCQHHPQPWAASILERLDVAHSTGSGKRELARVIGERRPAILPVARAAIPWLSSGPLTEREERIVLAVPREGGVRILDGSGSHTDMPAADLIAGYAATNHKHPVITLGESIRHTADLGAAVRGGLRAAVDGMAEPVLGNSFDVNFGLSGLRRWGDRVADTGPQGWGRVFTSERTWRTRLAECIDTEHTAPSAGRPLFARALRRAGLVSTADAFDRSAKGWRAIADGARSERIDLGELAGRIGEIRADEEAGIASLRSALNEGASRGGQAASPRPRPPA